MPGTLVGDAELLRPLPCAARPARGRLDRCRGRAGTSVSGGPRPGPGRNDIEQQAPFRRTAGVAIIAVVVLVELALGAAWLQLTTSDDARREADSLSIAFTDVQREFQNLRFLAVTEPRFDTELVETELALLERQLTLAATRLDRPETTAQLRADIEAVLTAADDLRSLQQEDPTDLDTALALATRGQRAAQSAVDRTASQTRELFLADALAAERTATIVVVVGALLLVTGAMLVWAVLLRYQRSFDEAWRVAEARRTALQSSNEQLAALASTRERFVSVLSHELRSPLAVIGAAGETLRHHGQELDDATRAGILESMRRQVARQQRLIDDLLLVAQHANEEPSPDLAPVEVADLFALLHRDESIEGIVVEFHAAPGTTVLADQHHLEQVVDNLVRNAAKYGGDEIRVDATVDDDEVVITVTDNGEGVPEELRATLFEPFTQADSHHGGIGLGLSVAQRLVEANAGTLTYRDADGGGAAFEVRLPRAEVVHA